MRAALCAAVLGAIAAWGAAAWAAPAVRARSIERVKYERQSAAESAKASALKAQAQSAAKAQALLEAGLAATAQKAAQTKAAAAQVEAEAAALKARRLADETQQAHDRRALEMTMVALLQGEAAARSDAASIDDAHAGAVAALTAPTLALAVADRQARIDETERLSASKDRQQADLSATRAMLAAQKLATAQQINEKAQLRLALLAEADKAAKRAAALSKQARSLAELADRISTPRPRTPGRLLTNTFSGPRASPAPGRILIAYGDKTPAGAARGITIATKPGASVTAPVAATIAYAGPFRSYGQVVILDQGNGATIVLTGLQSLLVEPGKKVSLGEIIGEMASSSASTAPELYFEVREAGRTVDPERWLSAARP